MKTKSWLTWMGIAAGALVVVALISTEPAYAKSACAPNYEKSMGMCYPKCGSGYSGAGPVCWQKCPSGFANHGAFCGKPKAYGRGTGYPWKFGDKPFSLNGARKRCNRRNPQGCEKSGAIIYPKCRSGFHAVGCCVCSPNCVNGMKDIGVSCAKKSHGRGVGKLLRDSYRGIFYRYIRDHRNIWMPSARHLRASEKTYLKQYFPARLVDKVKVVELLGMTGAFSHSASATTYGNDIIIIKKGKRTNELLRHEFVHVCQYDKLGGRGFGYEYADQYVDGGYSYRNIKFEVDAYGFQGATPIWQYSGYSFCK